MSLASTPRHTRWTSSWASSSTCARTVSTSMSTRGAPSSAASTTTAWPPSSTRTASSPRRPTRQLLGHAGGQPASARRGRCQRAAGRRRLAGWRRRRACRAMGRRLSSTIAVRPTSVDLFTFANEAAPSSSATVASSSIVEELDLTGDTMLEQLLWPNDFETLLLTRMLGPDSGQRRARLRVLAHHHPGEPGRRQPQRLHLLAGRPPHQVGTRDARPG